MARFLSYSNDLSSIDPFFNCQGLTVGSPRFTWAGKDLDSTFLPAPRERDTIVEKDMHLPVDCNLDPSAAQRNKRKRRARAKGVCAYLPGLQHKQDYT